MKITVVAFAVTGAFILFDVITGIIKALYLDGLNSTILRKGLFHKLSEILAVVFAFCIEYAVSYIELGIDIPVMSVVATYIVIMELISIIENLCCINPNLAKLFAPYLNKFKSMYDKKEDKKDE